MDGDGTPDCTDTCTDTDGDGYGDPGFPANTCPLDNCPGTVQGATVDTNGCPPVIPGDFDRDGDVDTVNFTALESCAMGPAISYAENCVAKDLDADSDIDSDDFAIFQRCWSGEGNAADQTCAN
jgi:hypothetical protein